jgi:long-chain acyl-CoA synthetase
MEYSFTTLYEIAATHGKKRGRKVALFVDDQKIRYQEILEKADKLAALLSKRGVKEGDRVAFFLRNSPEFIYAIFAVSKIGAVIVPVNTFLKEDEVSYILEDSGAIVLLASEIHQKVVNASRVRDLCRFIVWEGEPENIGEDDLPFTEVWKRFDPAVQSMRGLDDTAVIFYTSGTTGKPKGAMLSNRNILSNADSGRRTINVTSKDRAIVFLPMFHSFTFSIGVMLPMYIGASIVIIKSLQPFSNIFKQILLKRVTIFFGIPDVYNAIAKAKLPWYFIWFNRIRAFISGAAALQPKTLDAMAKKFSRATLLEGYGLSEASPAVCMNTFEKQKAGSVGTALYSYAMKVVNENMEELPRGEIGDIIVNGDNVMQGYLNRPEATAETIVNGWLLTGDMGYMDEDGFLFIVDRKKDLIISKGINIYPREIEEVIDAFPGIRASAVVGVEDERSGEVPIAYIELEEDMESLNEVGLKKYLREQLANYKLPKQIHTIEELPKNATGKVLKRVLKEQLKTLS